MGHNHEGARNPDCRVVNYIRSKVEAWLNIIVANVVVSYYAGGVCWRPFHQDRFRNDEEVAIVCSFGGRRTLTFRHLMMDVEEDVDQSHGSATLFDEALNSQWVHGIMPVSNAEARISVTLWGKTSPP